MPTLFESGKKTHVKDAPLAPTGSHRPSMGPLTAFAINPVGIRFETQQADETVLLFLRQHLVVNVPWVTITLFLVAAPFLLFGQLAGAIAQVISLPPGHFLVAILSWYLVTFGFAFAGFLKWFFNIYIVTNERIVDIDFLHLLYKQVSEARLINIQDVTYRTGGIVETMFNFGNVFIQTAGTQPNFEFLAIPNPEQVVKIISEAAEEAKKRGV